MVFYEYFLKSCVGDADWKACCTKPNALSAQMSNHQTEAFALLVLRNNYFAWLLEVKKSARDTIKTDYDPPEKIQECNEIGKVFLNLEIDLTMGQEHDEDSDDDEDLAASEEIQEDQITPEMLLVPVSSGPKYERLNQQQQRRIDAVRVQARLNPKYKDLLDALHQYDMLNAQETNIDVRRTKKRKMLRDFRVYTSGKDDQCRFKGWSKKAKTDLAALTKRCLDLSSCLKTKRFRLAYRSTFSDKMLSAKEKEKLRKQDDDNDDPNERVDHSKSIWGFGESDDEADLIPMVAV